LFERAKTAIESARDVWIGVLGTPIGKAVADAETEEDVTPGLTPGGLPMLLSSLDQRGAMPERTRQALYEFLFEELGDFSDPSRLLPQCGSALNLLEIFFEISETPQ